MHRLLTSIRVAGENVPQPGTKLKSEGADVGEISSAAYSPALKEIAALAYVRTEALEKKPQMQLAGSGEPPVLASFT